MSERATKCVREDQAQRIRGGMESGREGQWFHMIVILVVVVAVDSHSTVTTTSKSTQHPRNVCTWHAATSVRVKFPALSLIPKANNTTEGGTKAARKHRNLFTKAESERLPDENRKAL